DQGNRAGSVIDYRKRRIMIESRRAVSLARGKSYPELQSAQSSGIQPGCFLGMRNTTAGGHEIQLPGIHESLATEAVVVNDLPFQQPRHCLQPDVRMRRHIHRFFGRKTEWTISIEKTPRPDHPPFTTR